MNRWLCALLLLLAPAPVLAQSASCSFTSTPGAAFGPYDDASAVPTDTATSVGVNCLRNGGPANVSVTLQLGPGSGSVAARQMLAGGNILNYNLYRDAGRTMVWGQTAGVDAGSITINGIPNNGSKNGTFVIYGRIPAQQSVGIGSYTDSVQITVSP